VTKKAPPINLVHAALFDLDPGIEITKDGELVKVALVAIAELIANPPPMLVAHMSRD